MKSCATQLCVQHQTPDPEPSLGSRSPVNYAELQCDDLTLAPLFLRAVEGEPESGHCSAETFYLNRDVLHCKQRSQTRLVPKTMRNLVLASGYSIPCAGHFRKSKQFPDLKKQKNLAWLLLFWPILQKLPSVSEDIQQSPIQSFTLPFELSI